MGVLLFAPLLEDLYRTRTRDALGCSEVGLLVGKREGGRQGGGGGRSPGWEERAHILGLRSAKVATLFAPGTFRDCSCVLDSRYFMQSGNDFVTAALWTVNLQELQHYFKNNIYIFSVKNTYIQRSI